MRQDAEFSRSLSPVECGRLLAVPSEVFDLCERLGRAGHRCLLCGGAVRDLLLGRVSRDYDVATSATPDEAEGVLPREWIPADQPGRAQGSVALRAGGCSIELTTFRVEGAYADRRRPSMLRFVDDPEEDSRRRDFTVNALFLDLESRRILDFVGGMPDLDERRLRTVGAADERFVEDPLRVLRAIRFCVELGFVADTATAAALARQAPGVASLSVERVFGELGRILCSAGRARAIGLLVRLGVAQVLVPGLADLEGVPQPPEFHPEGEVLGHTALVLANLPEPPSPALAFAALLHDIAKPDCFEDAEDRIRFHGHDALGAERAAAFLHALGAPAALRDEVRELVAWHIRVAMIENFAPAKRARFLRAPRFFSHLALHRADCLASHGLLDVHDTMLALRATLPPEPEEPLLRGRDLIELGWEPGPRIGAALAAVEDARAEGSLHDRSDAIAFVRALDKADTGSRAIDR